VSMSPEPRERLRDIVARFGTSIADDPRRCEGVLRDLCGDHRREINLLVAALKERVPCELLTTSVAVPREVLMARLTRRMQDNHGTSQEFAYWAVESWALALGIGGAPVATPPTGQKPKPTHSVPLSASGRGPSAGPLPPPRPSTRLWPWVIALSILVLAGSLFYWQLSKESPPATVETPASPKTSASTEGSAAKLPQNQPASASRVPQHLPSASGAQTKRAPTTESMPAPKPSPSTPPQNDTLKTAEGDGGAPTSQTPRSNPEPTIVAFEVVPATVEQCSIAILRWTVRDASKVWIDSGVGVASATTGYRAIRPLQTTRFTLTAEGPGGSVSRDVTISVSHAMRSSCGP
jgi:hypothetical protein